MMNSTTIVAIVAVLVIIGGGLYYNFGFPEGEIMIEKGEEMLEEGEKMMKEGDDMKEEGEVMKKEGESMMKEGETGTGGSAIGDEMMKAPDGAMMSAGSYEAYSPEKLSKAATGDVVLFFRASWCPTCRGVDADIKANLKDIPKEVTILDVDYDNSTALKQKYGVTYQHTFVQVDANGMLIVKWSSSPTLAALISNIK